MSVLADQQTPEEIARASGSSFLVSFQALPPNRRGALTAIYAFCRVADDAADDADSARDGRERLRSWREELARAESGTAQTPIGQALARAMREFGVAARHLRAVLDGVQVDLDGGRFATVSELFAYCDQVAGAVGLACLPVFGAGGDAAERYAIALGRALQLTNIARDLHGDAKAGRCYVPQEWLAAENVTVGLLADPQRSRDPRAGNVLARLVALARAQFAAAAEELRRVPDPRALLAPETMGAVYRALLEQIETEGVAGVFAKRLRVPTWRKLWIAWQTRRRLK